MHYRNGRAAHEGDPVIGKNYGVVIAGKLHSTLATCETCNGQIAVPTMGGMSHTCVTIGEIHHAEDAFAAIEATMAAPQAAPVPPGGWPAAEPP